MTCHYFVALTANDPGSTTNNDDGYELLSHYNKASRESYGERKRDQQLLSL